MTEDMPPAGMTGAGLPGEAVPRQEGQEPGEIRQGARTERHRPEVLPAAGEAAEEGEEAAGTEAP